MQLKSPLLWMGGKGRLTRHILPLLPPACQDGVYVEPFCGGASLFFARNPSGVDVLNDLNGELINFFQQLRDDGPALREVLQNTPYARTSFVSSRDADLETLTPLDRAARFFLVSRSDFMASGVGGSRKPSWAYTRSGGNRARQMLDTVDHQLLLLRDRLRGAYLECDTAEAVMERFDSPQTVFYCDPPYHPDTRLSGGYAHEMGADAHKDLLVCLNGLQGMVALSGYAHDDYSVLLDAGWRQHTFSLHCATGHTRERIAETRSTRSTGSTIDTQRTECLWVNPALQERTSVVSRQSSLCF